MITHLRSFLQERLTGRGRKLGLFFVSSLGSRGVGIACQLLQVPIALKAMGAEAFGLWMTLSSFTYLLHFADLGVGVGVQNKLAEAFSLNQGQSARTLFNSAFGFLFAVGAGLALLLVPGSFLFSPERIFGLEQAPVIAEAPGAVVAMLVWFCLNLPLGLAQRLAYGLQKGWTHNVSQAVGNILALGGLALGAWFQLSLGWMLVAAVFPSLLANLGLLTTLLHRLGWLTPQGFEFRFATLRGLLDLGLLFCVQQIATTVLFALPPLIISGFLGAAAVTPYNLAQRLFNLFAVIQNAFMLPLWPAYAEAKARGEIGWIRRTLGRSLVATLTLSILPMAVGAWFAIDIIRLWVRNSPDPVLPSPALLWLLFGWNALTFLQQPFGYLLAGVSAVRRLTIYSVLSTLATVPLMILLVQTWRQEGVVVALIVGSLPFNMLGCVVEALRFLRTHREAEHLVPALEEKPITGSGGDTDLTITICTYNNARCLEHALLHISLQTDGGQLVPVLVVDNNSSDDTPAVVRSFETRLPNLRYISEPRQGVAFARQRAISECSTGWLAFIDDDNYLAPDWVISARQFIATHPRCGAFGGRNTVVWETPPHRLIRECGYAYAALNLGSAAQLLTGQKRWMLRGAGMVIRRRPLVQAGCLDWMLCVGRSKKEGGIAGEDTEMLARVAREGWEVWYNPACALDHFIVARRVTLPYLARLHFGFGVAEPVLRGMSRREPFALWALRMVLRLLVLLWYVLREAPRALFSSYRRAKLSIWFAYLRGAILGTRTAFGLDPEERRRWLGAPTEVTAQAATIVRA
jgi:O-antigen/teichoic acid export membrane protein/glycosyltransferase involved in cell wall biosynthesis